MRIAVALTLGLMLAGCNKPAASVREQEATQAASVAGLTGWDRVFASPQETIGAINQAGFGLDTPKTDAYRLQGHARMLSNSFAKAPNAANVVVAGADRARIDSIVYSLTLSDAADAKTARTRFAQTIGDFLTRFKLAGFAGLLDATRDGTPFARTVAGAPATVAVVPAANDAPPRLDVTFTRPAATSPANNKTQG